MSLLASRPRNVLVALAALAALALSFAKATNYAPNLYALQAQAWLQGRLDVPGPGEDLTLVDGRYYVAFPPAPTLLVLPLVAVFGAERAPVRALAAGLALLAGWVALRVLRRLDVAPGARPWLLAALLLGTGLWSCVTHSSGIWFLAHVVAFTAALLALEEALGPARGPLVGLWVGVALLSRQLSIYLVPFVLAAVWLRRAPGGRRAQVLHAGALLGVVAACGLAMVAFNAVRFGGLDTGYGSMVLNGHLGERAARYGLFSLRYVPFNLAYMFLQGPHVDFVGARLLAPGGMDAMGTALTFASPFIFVALAARLQPVWLLRAAWASVAFALCHMLLYYNNGYVQTNTQRFTLDFLPLLWVLVALGTKRVPERWWKGAVAWSVGLNAFALAVLPLLVRALRRL